MVRSHVYGVSDFTKRLLNLIQLGVIVEYVIDIFRKLN